MQRILAMLVMCAPSTCVRFDIPFIWDHLTCWTFNKKNIQRFHSLSYSWSEIAERSFIYSQNNSDLFKVKLFSWERFSYAILFSLSKFLEDNVRELRYSIYNTYQLQIQSSVSKEQRFFNLWTWMNVFMWVSRTINQRELGINQ